MAPGLVHYYFDSKEQLLGEVLHLCAARARELSSSVGAAGRRLTEDGFAAFHEELVGEPDWYRLRYETFALLGLRHPELLGPECDVAGIAPEGWRFGPGRR